MTEDPCWRHHKSLMAPGWKVRELAQEFGEDHEGFTAALRKWTEENPEACGHIKVRYRLLDQNMKPIPEEANNA